MVNKVMLGILFFIRLSHGTDKILDVNFPHALFSTSISILNCSSLFSKRGKKLPLKDNVDQKRYDPLCQLIVSAH